MSVVGPKKSGKTSVIEALIPYLKAHGYRVATVKHTSHQHAFDTPGTDSYRHAQAGAERVIIQSPHELVAHLYDVNADEMQGQAELLLHSFDIVLVEGFRDSSYPKVLVGGTESEDIKPPIIIRVIPQRQVSGPALISPKDLEVIYRFISQQLA